MRHTPYLTISLAILLLGANFSGRAQEKTEEAAVFGGQYSGLRPAQEKLVDDWFARFSQVVKKPVSPEEGYDNLALSVRTTFEAVTHALLRTPLTDASGKPLEKSSLGIVSKVDNVAGRKSGEGGDKQFRIYVQLVPDAMSLLARSTEFKRARDNTVYHKGYPVCFRSKGGAPSIQVSMTRSGKLGDIDVDYRSATFPVFLINGHLSASNSDVRAGNNYQRHSQQWAGLANWWRTLLGLPVSEGASPEREAKGEIIPTTPRIKPNAKPATAVHDFLQSWLVEQEPQETMAYFADSAFPCMQLETGQPLDPGMAKFKMLMALQDVNRRVGKIKDLSAVSKGVHLTGERARVIQQPYQAEFVLYDVREDLAEHFKCANKLNAKDISLKAARSHAFGKYVGAVFRLQAHGESGATIATLWQKRNKYWRLISYDVDPDFVQLRAAAAAPPAKAPTPAYTQGDKDMIRAAQNFYKDWFVRDRIDEALQYVSPQCYPCINLYRTEDVPAPTTAAEESKLIRTGMERISTAVGSVKKLAQAIQAPEPSHPDIKLVKHSDRKAFVIASIPDYMAAAAVCTNRKAGGELNLTASPEATYKGNYYATGFKLAGEEADSGVLWTVWSKVDGQWKIVSYAVISP
ncbi:MAG: hypothetical protein P8Z30_05675 [Acidobacteriota bacterium]